MASSAAVTMQHCFFFVKRKEVKQMIVTSHCWQVILTACKQRASFFWNNDEPEIFG